MGFQSTIRKELTSGIVGEIVYSGPVRAKPAILKSTNAANNVIGRAFRHIGGDDLEVTADGAGTFAGILANPKLYATSGPSTGALDPTLNLPNYAQVELVDMGTMIVSLSTAAEIGQNVYYANATGILAAGDTAPENHTTVPNAKVVRNNTTAGGLAVITLTN